MGRQLSLPEAQKSKAAPAVPAARGIHWLSAVDEAPKETSSPTTSVPLFPPSAPGYVVVPGQPMPSTYTAPIVPYAEGATAVSRWQLIAPFSHCHLLYIPNGLPRITCPITPQFSAHEPPYPDPSPLLPGLFPDSAWLRTASTHTERGPGGATRIPWYDTLAWRIAKWALFNGQPWSLPRGTTYPNSPIHPCLETRKRPLIDSLPPWNQKQQQFFFLKK